MSKKTEKEIHKKWERMYESEETISIWKFDSNFSKTNPYQVDIKYKKNKK
jgi:hypothetical protein